MTSSQPLRIPKVSRAIRGDSGNIKTDAQASKMVRKHNVSRAILMLRNARVLRAIRWQRDKHQKRYSAEIDEVIHQIAQ